MSESLTDAEIANLRKLYGALPDGNDHFDHSWAFFVAVRDALPGLLDELESLRRLALEQAPRDERHREKDQAP